MKNLFSLVWALFLFTPAFSSEFTLSVNVDQQTREQKRQQYSTHRIELNQFRIDKLAVYRAASRAERKGILTEVRSRLERDLCENMFPAWYGTPWDFNGISETPGEGLIACGYFVSTCLTHLGFNVPRIKLAQQPSQKIIGTFVPRRDMDISSKRPLAEVKKHLQKTGDGIYIVGLDTHVGFVVVKGDNFTFVHSSYYTPTKFVKAEPFDTKNPLADSKYRVFGKIFHDEMLIKWLSNGRFTV